MRAKQSQRTQDAVLAAIDREHSQVRRFRRFQPAPSWPAAWSAVQPVQANLR
jgi:hypothetical protein